MSGFSAFMPWNILQADEAPLDPHKIIALFSMHGSEISLNFSFYICILKEQDTPAPCEILLECFHTPCFPWRSYPFLHPENLLESLSQKSLC